ncbi:MAG: hypothetical protein ACYC1D_04730 [Acidimicrobiales bacterium]
MSDDIRDDTASATEHGRDRTGQEGPAGPDGQDDARLSALAALFGAGGPPDLDNVTSPVHWPSLPAADTRAEWGELRSWVDNLTERFGHLDHHVIPLCWWRHNGHVEALQALRDHERVSYSETAPGTAGVDWHRAFRDIEGRLREWTAQLPCGARHEQRPTRLRLTTDDGWRAFVDADESRREDAAVDRAVEAG